MCCKTSSWYVRSLHRCCMLLSMLWPRAARGLGVNSAAPGPGCAPRGAAAVGRSDMFGAIVAVPGAGRHAEASTPSTELEECAMMSMRRKTSGRAVWNRIGSHAFTLLASTSFVAAGTSAQDDGGIVW